MGSGASHHLLGCFRSSACQNNRRSSSSNPIFEADGPLDETLCPSCYLRSNAAAAGETPRSSDVSDTSAAEIVFKAISAASVSANSFAPLPNFDNAAASSRSHLRSSSSFSLTMVQGSTGAARDPARRVRQGSTATLAADDSGSTRARRSESERRWIRLGSGKGEARRGSPADDAWVRRRGGGSKGVGFQRGEEGEVRERRTVEFMINSPNYPLMRKHVLRHVFAAGRSQSF